MSIKILYFASLREQIGRNSDVVEANRKISVSEVWQHATGLNEIPGNLLIAVNQEYTSTEALVKDGDEVAFFPPVTGG